MVAQRQAPTTVEGSQANADFRNFSESNNEIIQQHFRVGLLQKVQEDFEPNQHNQVAVALPVRSSLVQKANKTSMYNAFK